MTEPIKTVGPDIVSSWPDWKVTVEDSRLVRFECKSPDCTRRYLCSTPLSGGAKAILRDHTKRHGPEYAADIRRER